MKIVFSTILIFFSFTITGQILTDSTAQALTYWNPGDHYNYYIENETYLVHGPDTTMRHMITYDVAISVKDSFANSYIIEWVYSDIMSNNPDTTIQNLMKLSEGMSVIFKTDENGVYIELVNWREIKEFIKTALDLFRGKYDNPTIMEGALSKIESLYTSREMMEAASTKDIHQFHNFYGASYTLGQVLEGPISLPNHYGGAPLDGIIKAYLYEIQHESKNFILKSSQEIDEEQLRNSVISHFRKIANEVSKDADEFTIAKATDINTTASEMHESGWIIWSDQKSTITIDDNMKVETRSIDLLKD